MQKSYHKLTMEQVFKLREYRKKHTRADTATKFSVSEQWVTHYTKMPLADVIATLSGYGSPSRVQKLIDTYAIAPILSSGADLYVRYNRGAFAGLNAKFSPYYFLETDFVPTFSTLVDKSKQDLLTKLIKVEGFKRVSISRIGPDSGIRNTYEAIADGKRISWKQLQALLVQTQLY